MARVVRRCGFAECRSGSAATDGSVQSAKRGDGIVRVQVDEAMGRPAIDGVLVLELNRALDRLAAIDGGLAAIVELRAFGGLTIDEAADVLQVSPSTAKREWRSARAWLTRELALGDRP